MTTTFRSDVVAAVMAVLQAQQTATPDQIRAVYSTRPGSFTETPCAYIGGRDETVSFSGGRAGYGLMERRMVGLTVTLVDTFLDPTAASDRLDDLVDLLVTRFASAYAQVAGGSSILQLASVTDTEIEIARSDGPSIVYRGAVLGFSETFESRGWT